MNARENGIKSDLARLDAMRDEDIDYSDIPDLGGDEEFWAKAVLVVPEKKSQITLRLDADVLDWFKSQGKGYQTRINAVLKAYKNAHER